MLENIRIAIAGLYVLLMSADYFMELSGRYAERGLGFTPFPYFEDNRTIQALYWASLNAWVAHHSIYYWFSKFNVLYVGMGLIGVSAVNRMRCALRPLPTGSGGEA